MNILIELLRYLLIMVICLYHYNKLQLPIAVNCVDFFFILSGFLLAKSALGDHPYEPRQYARRRFRQFAQLIALTVPCYVLACWQKIALDPWTESLNLLLDVLCLGAIFGHSVNFPLWYITALYWGSILTYLLLRKVKQQTALTVITVVLLTYTAVIYSLGRFNIWESYLIIYRGLAEVGIGVLLYAARQRFATTLQQQHPLWFILTAVCLLRVAWVIVTRSRMEWVEGCTLWSILILGLFTFKTKEYQVIKQLGRLSLYIYVIHIAVIRVLNDTMAACQWHLGPAKVLLLIILVNVAALILQKIDLTLQKRL